MACILFTSAASLEFSCSLSCNLNLNSIATRTGIDRRRNSHHRWDSDRMSKRWSDWASPENLYPISVWACPWFCLSKNNAVLEKDQNPKWWCSGDVRQRKLQWVARSRRTRRGKLATGEWWQVSAREKWTKGREDSCVPKPIAMAQIGSHWSQVWRKQSLGSRKRFHLDRWRDQGLVPKCPTTQLWRHTWHHAPQACFKGVRSLCNTYR